MKHETPPHWDRSMGRRLQQGEAAALGELYDRFASLAYGIAHRVLKDEKATSDVMREVFRSLWASSEGFDPARGPLRSWVAAEAHRLAVERLSRDSGAEDTGPLGEQIRAASTAARADYIVSAMPAPLREALEITHFQRKGYRQMAEELGIAEEEARRRLRLGLQLLATATEYPTTHPQPEETP